MIDIYDIILFIAGVLAGAFCNWFIPKLVGMGKRKEVAEKILSDLHKITLIYNPYVIKTVEINNVSEKEKIDEIPLYISESNIDSVIGNDMFLLPKECREKVLNVYDMLRQFSCYVHIYQSSGTETELKKYILEESEKLYIAALEAKVEIKQKVLKKRIKKGQVDLDVSILQNLKKEKKELAIDNISSNFMSIKK